jgi:hypothetical protein
MHRIYILLVIGVLALAGPVQSQTQPKASLADMFWLSGCWEGRQGSAKIEEIWSKPGGMSMIGLGRTVRNNRTVSFEFMQFREENGSLVFLPQPQGGPQVRFPLKEFSRAKLMFENPTHDFPQRVTYERKGNLLLASIEGTEKGKFSRHEFQMRKVRCS